MNWWMVGIGIILIVAVILCTLADVTYKIRRDK